jgi:hypothetical protein
LATTADIKAVQIIIGNYRDFIIGEQITEGQELLQWYEYQSMTLDAFTYDNKVIPFMGTFIPFISGITVQSGSVFVKTGNYSVYTTWLPTENKVPYVLDVENMGIEGINGVINDGVYWCTYSTYVDTDPNPLVTALDSVQYIVYGTSGTVTVNGNTYRIGEVFLPDGNGTISATGDAELKVLNGIRFIFFTCTYIVQKRLADLQVYIFRNNIQDDDLTYRIQVMYTKLEGVKLASIQNFTSAGVMQEVINDVTNELNTTILDLGIAL